MERIHRVDALAAGGLQSCRVRSRAVSQRAVSRQVRGMVGTVDMHRPRIYRRDVTIDVERGYDWSKAMILAPPSANGTPWLRRFGDHSTAFASGWMAIRGTRRRGAHDRGFVLSDHVDWPSLMSVVAETGAEKVFVTHGYADVVVRYLTEQGLDARVLDTQWPDENAEEL